MTNATIVEQLQQASQGLRFSSESDFPFEVFLWENCGPNLTPQALLAQVDRPSSTPVEQEDLEEFLAIALTPQNWHTAAERATVQQYRQLVETIQRSLSQVQVYRVGRIQIEVYIVGKTPDQSYAGLVTRVVET